MKGQTVHTSSFRVDCIVRYSLCSTFYDFNVFKLGDVTIYGRLRAVNNCKKNLFTISQHLHELVGSVTWPYHHNLQRAF
jgi:hypothetical protein